MDKLITILDNEIMAYSELTLAVISVLMGTLNALLLYFYTRLHKKVDTIEESLNKRIEDLEITLYEKVEHLETEIQKMKLNYLDRFDSAKDDRHKMEKNILEAFSEVKCELTQLFTQQNKGRRNERIYIREPKVKSTNEGN